MTHRAFGAPRCRMLDRICFSLSFQWLLALTRQAMQAYLLCKPLSFSKAEAMAPWGVGALPLPCPPA